MITNRSNEPPRWQDQDDAARRVWQYFNEILAPQLVSAAVSKPDCTLYQLYYALAKLRAKCEWVKKQTTNPDFDVKLYAEKETSGDAELKFGMSTVSGISYEPKIVSEKTWGSKIVELVTERLGNEVGGFEHVEKKIALSHLTESLDLSHQPKIVLLQSENYFRNLLNTQNLFDFLYWSSHLLYNLSNFPTTIRGNAAVCEQIIKNIFNEKSRHIFSTKFNIIIELQDWFAFFETQEDYTNFFVMSVVVNILNSYEWLSPAERLSLADVSDKLMLNPYRNKNQLVRNESWEMLKTIIDHVINHPSTTVMEKEYLNQLKHGKLTFRQTFSPLKKILSLTDKLGRYDQAALTQIVYEMSDAERSYFKSILDFENEVVSTHYKHIGYYVHDELRQRWFDLETFRCFKYSANHSYELIVQALRVKGFYPNRNVIANHDYYVYPYPYSNMAFKPTWVVESWLTPEEISSVTLSTLDFLKSNSRIRLALFSGGIRVQDMVNMSSQQIHVLCSPCAVYLYNSSRFITSRDLIAESVEEIESKMVKLFNKHLHNQPLPKAVDAQFQQIQMAQMFEEGVYVDRLTPRQPRQRHSIFSCFNRRDSTNESITNNTKSKKFTH